MNGIESLRRMNRPSRSGYELTVCMQYTSRTSYCWALIRYPLDLFLVMETIEQYYGMRWEEIAHLLRPVCGNTRMMGSILSEEVIYYEQ